jgi:hypothetical protein
LPVEVVLREEEAEPAKVELEPEAEALEEPLQADEVNNPLLLEAAITGPKTPPC